MSESPGNRPDDSPPPPGLLNGLARQGWRHARRVVIFVVGGTLVLLGIAMIVLPGPALVVIPAGLAVLATEFVWARWLLKRVKRQMRSMGSAIMGTSRPPPPGETK